MGRSENGPLTVCRTSNLWFPSESFEIRSDSSGDGLTLTGYAAVFNSPTRIDSWEGKFDEIISRGAFKKTISERTPILQWNHGNDPAVGHVPIGVVTNLREDAHGLFVEARLHDNHAVQPIRDAIASGAVTGMSFRFQVIKESWNDFPEVPVRTILETKLLELGPVSFPAYDSTSVGVRSDESVSLDADEMSDIVDDSSFATTPERAADNALGIGDAGAETVEPVRTTPQSNAGFLRFAAQIESLRSVS